MPEKLDCPCGAQIAPSQRSNHEGSKRHRDALASQPQPARAARKPAAAAPEPEPEPAARRGQRRRRSRRTREIAPAVVGKPVDAIAAAAALDPDPEAVARGEYEYGKVPLIEGDDLEAKLIDPNDAEEDELGAAAQGRPGVAQPVAAARAIPPAATAQRPGAGPVRAKREADDDFPDPDDDLLTVDAPGQAGAIPVDVFAHRRVGSGERKAPAAAYVPATGPKPATRGTEMMSADRAEDEYSIALGAARYIHPFSSFEWVTEPPDGGEPHKRRFTRCYPDEHVLMDIFRADGPLDRVRAEAGHVARQIAAYNVDVAADERWGYIPIVAGAELTFEDAAVALKGRIARFISREIDPIGPAEVVA